MNSNFTIQDYMNRLSVTESKLNQLPKEPTGDQNPANKSFQNHLDENLVGKISSSSLLNKNNIKDEIQRDGYRKKLFNASVEFESMFVKIMLNQMKKTVEKQNLMHGGYAEEIFEDMLYDEYAKEISKNESIGIAEQIYNSLSKNLPPIPPIDEKI
jgi:peptidoglycan hydrolase FlgJ